MKFLITCLSIFFLIQGHGWAEESFQTIGNITASAYSKLGSQVMGKVEKIYVDVGDFVGKEQVLIALDSKFALIEVSQKQAASELAQIVFKNAERDLKRMEKLWLRVEGDTPTISKKRYEDAEKAYEEALNQVRQSQDALKKAQFNMDETAIKAPYEGVIAKRLVDQGETVVTAPGVYLIEIAAVNPLYLEFSVPQKLLSTLEIGQTVCFQVEGYKNDRFEARIERIYPLLDEATRSVKCRAVIQNNDLILRPGSLAKVEIKQS